MGLRSATQMVYWLFILQAGRGRDVSWDNEPCVYRWNATWLWLLSQGIPKAKIDWSKDDLAANTELYIKSIKKFFWLNREAVTKSDWSRHRAALSLRATSLSIPPFLHLQTLLLYRGKWLSDGLRSPRTPRGLKALQTPLRPPRKL